MLTLPSENVSPILLQDFDVLVEDFGTSRELHEYQDEIFAVWYASPFIKRVCLAQPDWLKTLIASGSLQMDCDLESYQAALHDIVSCADSVEEVQRALRKHRAAEFARIAWRDLQEYATTSQTLIELSAYAEVCVHETLQWCYEWLRSRPSSSDFIKTLPQQIVVFALGKLGGGELNFSSDIDIVFAYVDDSEHTQEQSGKAIEFYLKVVQLFIKVLSEQTQDGFVFRVDTRLRPFGDSGTLLPSFLSIDQYFQTHGRDWERYAWIKARVIAGDHDVGNQFLREILPFIYRRYLDYGSIQSLREMKTLIDAKARQDSAKENLKIGLGGIREIEFIAQMFQLIYGGKDSSLQIHSTQDALGRLAEQGLLDESWVENLMAAYLFLRKAENGLQMREDQQIHSLPLDPLQQDRYAYLLGYKEWQVFYEIYKKHAHYVNTVYQSLLEESEDEAHDGNEDTGLEGVWLQIDDKEYCLSILTKKFGEDAEHIYSQLKVFAESSLVQKLIPVARTRLNSFMPILLLQLLPLEDIKDVLDRFLKILKNIVQRSTYISLLLENKSKLSKIFELIHASPWISQYVATHPVLLDEIFGMDDAYEPPSMREMQQQLSVMFESSENDIEHCMQDLREFKHSQVIQIATADIVENYPIMKVSDHLSWLAEVCINHAVAYAYLDLIKKYGEPRCILEDQEYTPDILVVEYGKLGGLELSYGSDLDIVFLHNSMGSNCETTGVEVQNIHNDVFFTRLVQRTIHILSTVTSAGKVFDTDLRLRPHGESGAVISSIKSYENYLLKDAWLWEHQALVRARAISSSPTLHKEFLRIREGVLCQPREIRDVQESILNMRAKMLEANKTNSKEGFHIKKDTGGLIDIEFIVQYFVLAHAEKHPQICKYTDNIRILDACVDVGLLDKGDAEELKDIYLKFRKYLHHLNLKLLPEVIDEDVFAKERSTIQNYWASLLHSDKS